MFSCDYNGWADVPEAEREAIDAFEAGLTAVLGTSDPLRFTGRTLRANRRPTWTRRTERLGQRLPVRSRPR